MLHPQEETSAGTIAYQNKKELLDLAGGMDMVVIGPGLSLNNETVRLTRELVAEIETSVLIDGDGITALSGHLEGVKKRRCQTIITPHMGEMSRLSGQSIGEIEKDRFTALRCMTKSLNAHVVLKGAHTLIGYPDGSIFVNLSGNPGMAKAGTGDVLDGVIAAMFGQGLHLPKAVRMGVYVHGLAGDLAARELGEDGISAQDILEYIPEAMKTARETGPEDFTEAYGISEVI